MAGRATIELGDAINGFQTGATPMMIFAAVILVIDVIAVATLIPKVNQDSNQSAPH